MNRSRLVLAAVIAILASIVFFGGRISVFLTDWIWFAAVEYESVFTTVLLTRLGMGVVVGLVVAALIFVNALLASRGPRLTPVQLFGQPSPNLHRFLERSSLPRLALLVSLGVGVFLGLGASTWWQEALLAVHGGEFGYVDPVLGRDAGFYVFVLPLLQQLQGLLSFSLVLTLAGTAAVYLLRGWLRIDLAQIEGQVVYKGMHVEPRVRTHLGVLVAVLFVAVAAGTFLRRYAVMYGQSGLISGAGYADVVATLPLLLVQVLLILVAGGLALVALRRLSRNLAFWTVAVLAAGWLLTSMVPEVVQRFLVLPNELAREGEYITHHIEATRQAFGLGKVEERSLSGEAELTVDDIEANHATINNVRLWDHGPLLDTFSQVQEIRTYYEFVSVDNDRYVIDGELRQIMLSPRELVARGLPARARTWVNESLVYTHGYGLALGPVNQVTEQGLPELFVKDLPPRVAFPDDLHIERPELYYGEAMSTPVFVRTRNAEFDYPAGEENAFATYAGQGGAPVGGIVRRSLFSARLRSTKVLLTSDFTEESRVLLYRRVGERVRRIAPFLSYDRDPYLVIADGRLVWILDAYTVSGRFPYAQATGGVSYMRNAVKATVDAYDGTVTFYATEPGDPILAAWSSAFPDLVRPLDDMPASLRAHLRYPQDFFSVQTTLFAIYHMTDPQTFYNREDEWEVPAPGGTRMSPYYTIMKIPGEESEEFIVMLPFVPRDKPNLAAWMVARSDGDLYGQLLAYKFPKDKMVYGPNMIVARINQDDAISEKLSLWNQQGSAVVLGTLLVIPIEESLIYIQPLYLRAESGSIPELKRVIVGYQNEIAMEPTLEGALERLFGKRTEVREVVAAEPGAPVRVVGWRERAEAARGHFEAATQAQREGDWARYGEELESLEDALRLLLEVEEPAPDPEPVPSEGTDAEGAP